MANTVTFGTVGSIVVAGLNAAGTYTAVPADPRFYSQQILDAINMSDGAVVETILSNPTHPRAGQYLTSNPVAHQAKVPNHMGPVRSVTIVDTSGATVVAKPWSAAEIEWERKNALVLLYPGHYFIDADQILYHNGTGNANCWFAIFNLPTSGSFTTATLIQSPDEYMEAVASKTLSFLFNVEGENSAAAEFYDNHWRAFENSIKGARAMPEFDLYMAQQPE